MTINEDLKIRLNKALENVKGEYIKDKRQVLETLAIISSTCQDLTKKYDYGTEDIRIAYSILIEDNKVATRRLSRNIDFLKKLSENNEFGA